MRIIKLIFVFCGLTLNIGMSVQAADLIRQCDNCHGENGNSLDDRVPSIAGFSFATIEDILYQFKKRERPAFEYTPEQGETSDMQTIAKDLSDQEITMLAEHYSAQKFRPFKQAFDSAQAEIGKAIHKEKCEKCHSEGASNANDDAAILAGQGRRYLEMQFELNSNKDRGPIPDRMRKRFGKLSASEKLSLIEYYISQY